MNPFPDYDENFSFSSVTLNHLANLDKGIAKTLRVLLVIVGLEQGTIHAGCHANRLSK